MTDDGRTVGRSEVWTDEPTTRSLALATFVRPDVVGAVDSCYLPDCRPPSCCPDPSSLALLPPSLLVLGVEAAAATTQLDWVGLGRVACSLARVARIRSLRSPFAARPTVKNGPRYARYTRPSVRPFVKTEKVEEIPRRAAAGERSAGAAGRTRELRTYKGEKEERTWWREQRPEFRLAACERA